MTIYNAIQILPMAKCTGKHQKIAYIFNKSDGETIHTFHLYNLPNWEHKFFLWQSVGAAQQISLKIVLTFDCGNGETIYKFNLHNLPRGA